jgi:DNA polymerase-3 subunit gamma/tau
LFENVIHQGAVKDISQSLNAGNLPNALLFWGEKTSGKLTGALELARVLSCEKNAAWDCPCASCLRHKQLVSQNILLAGRRDCLTEILAARQSLVAALQQNAPYLTAASYFFARSVRKLTLRFPPALVEGGDAAKISVIVSEIEQTLEEIEPSAFADAWRREDGEKLAKLTSSITGLCEKLDSEFMYPTLPVTHVRSISAWARFTVQSGKKTVIIENAENMREESRNALLKILEEPPENIVFVLATANRQMMMPTILSRVRTYRFEQRSREQQLDILKRVFHAEIPQDGAAAGNTISAYLDSFLPVNPADVERLGRDFLLAAARRDSAGGETPEDTKKIAAAANNFSPARLIDAFFEGMILELKRMTLETAQSSAREHERAVNFSAQCMERIREAKTRVTLTNQNAANALDILKSHIARM